MIVCQENTPISSIPAYSKLKTASSAFCQAEISFPGQQAELLDTKEKMEKYKAEVEPEVAALFEKVAQNTEGMKWVEPDSDVWFSFIETEMKMAEVNNNMFTEELKLVTVQYFRQNLWMAKQHIDVSWILYVRVKEEINLVGCSTGRGEGGGVDTSLTFSNNGLH